MPPLLRAALPAALLAAACGAQAANRAYDELLRQGEQAFDRMLIACQSAAPGMAATWQAQAPGLRRKLREAAQLAFAQTPELQRPPSALPHDETRQVLQLAARQMQQAVPLALMAGPAFCQPMIERAQQTQTAELARQMKHSYQRLQARVRQQPRPALPAASAQSRP